MNILTTPEDRFDNLPGYDFEPNYINVAEGLRMHYVVEGNPGMPTVLLLHGEPSWSFLYRKMIPVLANNGFRAIVPDLIGFGKSSKPAEREAYSYQNHIDWLTTFITELDLNNIILFCQDWGGLTGLRLITLMQDRFDMVVASNTFLPTGHIPMPESFMQWRAYSQHSEHFDMGKVLNMATLSELRDDVKAAYNAPFPSEKYKAGARMFPLLVPIEQDDPEAEKNRQAWEVLKQWTKPFLTIFGDGDTIMLGAEKVFQKLVPGAQGQDHAILHAGHFIQEEKGQELAEMIMAFVKKNS